MNTNISEIVKNIGHSTLANMISASISFIIVMIVPRMIGVEEFGYFQLYLLYASLVSVFQFGHSDGVYLRYAGIDYDKQNKPLLRSQYIILTISQLIVLSIICLSYFIVHEDSRMLFLLVGIGFCSLLMNPRQMLLRLLTITGRIKNYAQNIIAERIVYLFLVLFLLFAINVRQFQYLLLADLIAKLLVAVMIAYLCRDIVFVKGVEIKKGLREASANVRVGIKMQVAHIASLLTLGIVQILIERAWDVATFGKVSLALSIANVMLVFISAVGLVMFPVIKSMDTDNYGEIYKKLRFALSVPLLGLLVVLFPARLFLIAWLPQYAESAVYLVLLFPICVFESKVYILTGNFLKAIRLEKHILYVHLASFLVSAVLTVFFAFVLRNLTLSVLTIVFIAGFRCILFEFVISKKIGIKVFGDILYDVLLVALFISTAWFLSGWTAGLIYFSCFAIYLLIKRNNIRDSIKLFLDYRKLD